MFNYFPCIKLPAAVQQTLVSNRVYLLANPVMLPPLAHHLSQPQQSRNGIQDDMNHKYNIMRMKGKIQNIFKGCNFW